jgi:hypothetical protein
LTCCVAWLASVNACAGDIDEVLPDGEPLGAALL